MYKICNSRNIQVERFYNEFIIAGIALGIGLKEVKEQWSKREAELYVGFLGNIFLNMLKCIIIPLVIPSLITAIGKEKSFHALLNSQ